MTTPTYTADELDSHEQQKIALKALAEAAEKRVTRKTEEAGRLLELLLDTVPADQTRVLLDSVIYHADLARLESAKALYGGIVYAADQDRLGRWMEEFLLADAVCRMVALRSEWKEHEDHLELPSKGGLFDTVDGLWNDKKK